MKIEKAHFGVDGDRVSLSVPLAKVDAENRIVSGFATLDNVDTQADVVTAEASVAAFARSRGNLREMHQPVAVGRVVSFKEDEFYDSQTEKFYRGIFVDAYVSKGAEATWEKVLDGTLAAFSIGGAIRDGGSETSVVKSASGESKTVRIIKDYDLTELSLVDSGANQLANIFSITKMDNGDMKADGIAADVQIENVFYCTADNIAKATASDAAECANCNNDMANIGWFESGADREASVKELVDEHLNKVISTRDLKTSERSEDMTKELEHGEHGDVTVNSATADDVVENAENIPAKEDEEVASNGVAHEERVEETVPSEEVKEEEQEESEEKPNIEKMIGDLSDTVKESFEKSVNSINEINEKLVKSADTLENKITELVTHHQELEKRFESLKSEIGTVEKRIGSVEAGTAVKKSGDLGGSTEDSTITKRKESLWGGHFLGISDL